MTDRLSIETSLVAHALQEPRGYVEAVALGVTPSLFSDDALRAIWSLLGASVAESEMVPHLLKIENGLTRLNEVTAETYRSTRPVALAAASASRLVQAHEKTWVLSQLTDLERVIHTDCDLEKLGKIANEMAARLLDRKKKRARSWYEIGEEWVSSMEEGRKPVQVGFGIPVQDKFLNNFLGGELVLVAARPGEGKTAWAIQLAQYTAKLGTAVHFLTGELKEFELRSRGASQETGIDGQTLRGNDLDPWHADALRASNLQWKDRPLYAEEMGYTRTSDEIVNGIRRAFMGGAKVIIIDYVGLVGGGKFRSRHEEMADLSRRLKLVAQEAGGVIIALAQLNRASVTEKKQGKLNLSHLAESDQFGRDADMVFLFSRKDDGTTDTTITIAKNRNGPIGEFALAFSGRTTQFTHEVEIRQEESRSSLF